MGSIEVLPICVLPPAQEKLQRLDHWGRDDEHIGGSAGVWPYNKRHGLRVGPCFI